MATLFNATAETFGRTANLPSISSFTVMGWIYLVSDVNNQVGMFRFGNSGPDLNYELVTLSDGTTLSTWNGAVGASSVSGSALSLATWYHVAITVSGTGAGQFLAYLNGVLDITNNGDATNTAVQLDISQDIGSSKNIRIAAVKVWSAALSATDIISEMRQYAPVRWSDLNAWYPMLNAATDNNDFSGNANNLTITNGSPTTAEGPPLPWMRYKNRKASFTTAATNRGWYISSAGGWW